MDKTRILLVEDDPSLGFVIKDNLQDAEYEVKLCRDGSEGFQEFYRGQYDLCLLDVMLPKKDGFSLGQDIRKINPDIPIIYLTAKSLTEDKIKGFASGADDYVTKPFEMEELLLRLEAILKRANNKYGNKSVKKDIFEISDYTFDYKNLELKLGTESNILTRKEAELLRLLCIHSNEVLERNMALNIVWGSDDYFLGRSMDVFISKLRRYLNKDEKVQIINVHGVGFKLMID